MIYEIQSKNDISAGACLVIRFPEEELDKKALYTIEADRPSFIVPFRHRSIDGQIECVYQLGDRSRLHYRFGKRNPKDYVELWSSILQPILDCGDWFLKPSSFVLEIENIFVGRDERTVSYIYVPSRTECVGSDALNAMVREIAERNPVGDLDMENKVLRAIMQDIRPGDFLKMLKNCVRQCDMSAMNGQSFSNPMEEPSIPERIEIDTPAPMPAPVPSPAQPVYSPSDQADRLGFAGGMDRDISVDYNDRKRSKHKENPTKEKKKKPERGSHRGGLFGGKKKNEIIGGAADPGQQPSSTDTPWNVHNNGENPSGITALFDMVGFRLIGNAPLPKTIEVDIEPKGIFTIGRYDVSTGVKQSSFEFEKDTKAVSRHHAAVELNQDGTYTIVDLNSRAGTFVDGVKITPNIPVKLTRGCRVSFGTCGADYMWEELG